MGGMGPFGMNGMGMGNMFGMGMNGLTAAGFSLSVLVLDPSSSHVACSTARQAVPVNFRLVKSANVDTFGIPGMSPFGMCLGGIVLRSAIPKHAITRVCAR